jgi:hypothetical protein
MEGARARALRSTLPRAPPAMSASTAMLATAARPVVARAGETPRALVSSFLGAPLTKGDATLGARRARAARAGARARADASRAAAAARAMVHAAGKLGRKHQACVCAALADGEEASSRRALLRNALTAVRAARRGGGPRGARARRGGVCAVAAARARALNSL